MSALLDEKQLSLISQLTENTHENTIAFHDLQGPMININGFSQEINKSLLELLALISRHRGDIEPALLGQLEAILKNDLVPCIEFLDGSNRQLGERLSMYFSSF